MEIFVLQPFKNYECLLSPELHVEKIEKLKRGFELARLLGTNTIQIPTNFWKENTTGNEDVIVKDLQEVADLEAAQAPPFRFASSATNRLSAPLIAVFPLPKRS